MRFPLFLLFLHRQLTSSALPDPTDVLAGSFIGAATAFFAYLTYYPSPIVLSTRPSSDEAEERLRVMERPKMVYGVKEAGDGWDESGRAEEGRVRLDGADGEGVVV